MELKIYNKTGNLILTASPNSSSSLTEEIGGECCVSVSFTHTSFVLLDVDNYIEVLGIRYKIKRQYRPKQKNTQTYEYSVKFYAPIHDAEDVLMLFSEGDTTSEFNYDGGPREHLQLWVDNMNRLAGKDVWSIGTVISAENKNIEYKNLNCWDAAFSSNGIAATFDTEMWADGFVINLCKASHGERQELGYMQGLTNLSQEDNGEVKFFTRLFPLGSTRNIDASKYGYSRLQLPSRAKYVDKNVDLYGVKEETEEAAFSAIYPKYVGTISSVRTEEKENEEGRKYTVYYFKDNSMSFNPDDYQIPEHTYMLEFQTGELAGRGTDGSFQAAWHENTKEWEITNVYPDDTTQIPGGVIIPKPGDQYIPWNFSLPQEYTTAAEQAYELAVNNFLSNYSFDPAKYTGTTDRNYVERNNTPLRIGQNVRLLSDNYFTDGYKDTRIIKVQRKLNDLYQATITCTDQVGTTWKTSVNNQLNNLQYILTKQEQQAIIDIIKTTDSKTPSDYNVLSALKAIGMFHRKDKTDENPYLQKFLKGIEAGLYAEGGKDGSKLHADGLAELGRLQVNGDSEFRGNLSSKEFISGFLTGKGWAIQLKKVLNAAGVEEDKYVAEFDNLIIRGTLRVYEFIVSQLLGENDNRIFTAMLEVDHYDKSSGKVYLDTQDGKFYNPFRVDDYIMVQQYNGMPSEENNFYVTKQYELIVTEVGMENELAWVKFKDFTTTMDDGNAESLIAKKDTFVRIDNLSDPDRKGIIQMMTVGSNTPYMDVAYGLKTDPDNALKVRIGKLEGIYNSLFGWLKDYGAYLLNVYAIGSYRQRVTGEDLYTKIEMLKEQFLTEFKSQYYTLTDEDNFLKNTAFTADMQYWTVTNNVQFFKIGGVPLYLNRNLITSKIGVAQVEEYNGKKMLHLNNNTVKQLNKDIRKPGSHKEYVTDDDTGSGAYKEVKDTLYLYLRFYARTSGRLTIGFPASSQEEGALPYTEIDIDEDAEMQVMQWQGTWDSAGDFVLGYTGDMYVSLLSLTTEPLDNFKVETSTRFEQTSRYILLVGEKVDEANKSITELGIRIDAAEENITLYAQKISETEEKLAKIEITVDGITSTVADGDSIVSTINQTATTVAIKAERINLNGYVSANRSFSVEVDGTINLGGFTVDKGRFIWEQHDYFGGISRGLKLGYSNYDDEGVIDVRFNPATSGVFGVKIVGRAAGSACIYANSQTLEPDYTSRLPIGMAYAGYFKGPVVSRDTDYGFSSDVIAGSEFRAITGWNSNGTYSYKKGISFDSTYNLDDVRFTVRNGLIVALHKDNGEIIIQG